MAAEEKPLGAMQRRKRCLRCATEFVCGADSETGRCWCAELPPIMPMTDEGCLCEKCLKEEMESLRAQRNAEQAGLCGRCARARVLQTKSEARIYLCEAAATDKRLSKYPRLPMLSCTSHTPTPA